MYCLNCGQQIPDGVEFCTKCGARTGTAGAPYAPAYRAASPAPGTKPRSKGPVIAIVVSLIVIAVSAGILAFVLLGGNHDAGSTSAARSSAAAATFASSEEASSASTVSDEGANGSQSASRPAAAASGDSGNATSASASAETGGKSSGQAEGSSEQTEPAQPQTGTQPGIDAPFWGVWIGAFKNVDGAEEMLADAKSAGLPAMIFETTDWSNLNNEHYYVVSVGVSADEATAKQLCEQAKEAGFDGAYVKYSGERR